MIEKITLLEYDSDLDDTLTANAQQSELRAQAKRRLISPMPDVVQTFPPAAIVSEALRQLIREKKAA